MSLANDIINLRYSWTKEDGFKETWDEIARRVTDNVLSVFNVKQSIKDAVYEIISKKKFIPGGRFLAQSGREFHQTSNCFLLRAEDSREGWADVMNKSALILMTGGGVGIEYSNIRPYGTPLKRSGGIASGPIPLMKVVNEIGRGVMAGGSRRSAVWSGLHWKHQDIYEFITLKNWSEDLRKIKEKDFNFPAPMDMTNISVSLDKEFFDAFDRGDPHAQEVYWSTVKRMCKTAEPGFSINYDNPNENLRNPCCEIVSEDDSDVCCLGSINLARIGSIEELEWVTELATIFLLCGTEYTDSPYEKAKEVRLKNRRTGLGLMGLHEWLILRNYPYGPNPELADWLQVWKDSSDKFSEKWAAIFNINTPIKKRAIAPNGSIGIVGETTSGIEPIFAVAYLRRYLTPNGWKEKVVVDPVAERLINLGINPDNIEDAYTLSLDVERRIKFQAFVQEYVDNAISSTINLPAYGTEGNDDYEKFGNILYPYLRKLRGITVYPDGARGGQPLVRIDYKDISKYETVYEENESCVGGVCGL
jgi:ribonucleoside-diphosphate reductase alpha chain